MRIPKDWPVRPIDSKTPAKDRVTCGACGLSWDDGISTSMTPAPSARCPFETFHVRPKFEYRTVDTSTLKGLETAEKLHTSGWKTLRVGLFSIQFERRVAK